MKEKEVIEIINELHHVAACKMQLYAVLIIKGSTYADIVFLYLCTVMLRGSSMWPTLLSSKYCILLRGCKLWARLVGKPFFISISRNKQTHKYSARHKAGRCFCDESCSGTIDNALTYPSMILHLRNH